MWKSQILILQCEKQHLSWNLWKQETVEFLILNFKQKAGGFRQKFTIFYLSLLWKAAMSIFRPQFPGLHTQRNLRTGKKSGVIKGNKHSPFYPVSCLSSHKSYLLPYRPRPNWRLGLRAAGTMLIQHWRWRPGTEQMQPEDKVLGEEGKFQGGEGAGEGRCPFPSARRPRGSTSSAGRTGMVQDCHLLSPSLNQRTETSKQYPRDKYHHLVSKKHPSFLFFLYISWLTHTETTFHLNTYTHTIFS